MPGVTPVRLAALALAAVAAMPGVSAAAPEARPSAAVTDAAFVMAWDDPAKPTVGMTATMARVTREGSDVLYLCINYSTRTVSEHGCAVMSPRPVTTRLAMPETARIAGRVPVYGRRGGWMEIAIDLTATRPVAWPPASASHWAFERPVAAGLGAPATFGVYAGPYLARVATMSGTFRTDRGVRMAARTHPDAYFQPMVIRSTLVGVRGSSGL